MKSKIAIFLSVLILISSLAPVSVFASGDNGLENALKSVKSVFEIPADYTEFTYNVNTELGKQIWNLGWTTKNGTDGNINVRVDEKGNIISYSFYKSSDYQNIKKFPELSKTEAEAKAEGYINKMNPSLLKHLKYMENPQSSLMDIAYNFYYYRIENGIPFYYNSLNIEINKRTGELQNFNLNWNDDLVFPKPDAAISTDKAKSAYKDKLGLMLCYNSTYDNDSKSSKTFAAYVPKVANGNIDAVTGEKFETEASFGPYYGMGGGMGAYAMPAAAANTNMQTKDAKEEAKLTPDEISAVEKVSKLLTQQDAESIARKIDVLELTSDFKVTYANLSKGWSNPDDFLWNLNFNKEVANNPNESRSVGVTLNAKTGEIVNFNSYFPSKEGQLPTIDEAAARAAVDEFFKKFNPSKYAECQFDTSFKTNYGPIATEKLPRNYNFNYIRLANGVAFPSNSVNISFDTVSGKITGYYVNWQDVKFASVSNIIRIEDAYDKFFSQVGLELQYKTINSPEIQMKMAAGGGTYTTPEVKLVYTVKADKPAIIDANTGMVVDASGQPFKETKPVKYSDISGNFAEKQITALAEYNISLEGTEFKPNDKIKQKDFFRLLSKTLSFYSPIADTSGDKDLDDIYKFLGNEGIIKPGEKAPDSSVTREDAVKFIIRALKYDKIASIKGIFTCDLKDASNINPELIGSVSIAKGLGIISGNSDGYFNPKTQITRAETAVIIYNYLRI